MYYGPLLSGLGRAVGPVCLHVNTGTITLKRST